MTEKPRRFGWTLNEWSNRSFRLSQLNDNLASLEFTIPADLRKRLDEVSALEPVHPYVFFGGMIQGMIHGGVEVKAWKAASGH